MTYQPLLPEAAAGNVEPRHVTIPLRRALHRVRVLNGKVVRISHADRVARLRLLDGEERDLVYDHVVVAPGSAVLTKPVPGLAELAVGFKTLGEAVHLRNHVLDQLALAASTLDPGVRRRALTFVVVGGGFPGVEATGELSDLTADIVDKFDGLRRDDLRWILVEASGRLMPEVGPELGGYTADVLRHRGIEIRLDTTIASCVGGPWCGRPAYAPIRCSPPPTFPATRRAG
jgi:NADH:ubiquinone reductase (H+-translocating)